MIKIKKADIFNMKLTKNRVIVKISRKPDELILNEEIKIYIDFTFSHEANAPTRGMVVNICDGLDSKKMNWITENELQRGDIAVYSFESAMHCWFDDESRSLIDEFKDIYFILDYEDIFCVKRGKELIPINGYVLCEPISEFTGKTKLHIPDEVRNKKSEKFGRVKYVGARNKGYQLLTDRGPKLRPELHDAPIKEGDVILFDKYCDLPIEHAMHSGITGQGQVLYRMHQCYIKAVMS